MTVANGAVLFRHRTYVDAGEGILVGSRMAVGRTTGNTYIELHLQADTGETLAINMPEGFNPPVDLVVGRRYNMAWVEGEDGMRLEMADTTA